MSQELALMFPALHVTSEGKMFKASIHCDSVQYIVYVQALHSYTATNAAKKASLLFAQWYFLTCYKVEKQTKMQLMYHNKSLHL